VATQNAQVVSEGNGALRCTHNSGDAAATPHARVQSRTTVVAAVVSRPASSPSLPLCAPSSAALACAAARASSSARRFSSTTPTVCAENGGEPEMASSAGPGAPTICAHVGPPERHALVLCATVRRRWACQLSAASSGAVRCVTEATAPLHLAETLRARRAESTGRTDDASVTTFRVRARSHARARGGQGRPRGLLSVGLR
jgi:hypothetical protein